MNTVPLRISNFYVTGKLFTARRGFLSLANGTLTFYTFKSTISLGEVASLHYKITDKTIEIQTSQGKRYTFSSLHSTFLTISQPQVRELMGKAAETAGTQTDQSSQASMDLITAALGDYEAAMYSDAKYTHAMWAVILDASGAKKL